jgi:intein/homing endonuclease
MTDDWVEEYRSNRWLGLGDTSKIPVINPFDTRTDEDIDNPHVFLLDLMRRPENFGFTCKILFGKTLAPFQLAILRELWVRPFPMLLGSRGMGKCVRGDTLIQTSRGVVRIADIASGGGIGEPVVAPGLTVFGESGFRNVAYSWNNGVSITVKLLTKQGYELEGTTNHPVRVVDGGEITWRDLSDVRPGDVIPIDRTESWHEHTSELADGLAYLLGLIAGDGGFTKRGNIVFTTADAELLASADRLAREWWGKGFTRVESSKYSHGLYSVDIWERLFSEYGFPSSVCSEKDVPRCVLTGPKTACAAFLRGLFDTDGCVEKDRVSLSAKSERLVRTVQFLLTRFGIISKRRPKFNKAVGRTYWHLEIRGRDARLFAERIGFGLTRKRESLSRLVTRKTNTNRDVVPALLVQHHMLALAGSCRRPQGGGKRPKRLTPSRIKQYGCTYEAIEELLAEVAGFEDSPHFVALKAALDRRLYFDVVSSTEGGECETFDVHVPDDHSFVSNGIISHNSWILAVYIMLRALFNQGSKVVICGAAFRQAKVVFDYCQALWEDGPVLRDIVGSDKKNGPRRDVDRCSLRMGDSIIVALPLGDGTKIRGQRANIIVCDEFASVPRDIFETVVRGFAAVSLDPVAQYQQEMKRVALKELGLWTDAHEALEESALLSNQTVISGTAYYAFNHFYEYWKQYKAIIESRGDPRKTADIFGGKIPSGHNWKDYSVIRVPVERLPPKFMDEKSIAQAKATVHTGIYQMEYGACATPGTKVITACGVKPIESILPGELVLTHRGRLMPVTKVYTRDYEGDIVVYRTLGYAQEVGMTPEHPFWLGGGEWGPVSGIADATYLANLRTLNGCRFLDIRSRVTDWMDCGDRIYPRHSQSRFSREQLSNIRALAATESQSEIGRRYGVRQNVIHAVVKKQRFPKNAIPATIALDYDFGLVIGYYAAEGSAGANGRAVGFALDGHVNARLESYVSELVGACERVFGFTPKVYYKDSVANVTINQRLVCGLLKSICPGLSQTKFIDPDILFSTPEFLRGFIVGYWNGDGHLPPGDRSPCVAGCVNEGLLSQVRTALSYFGISATMSEGFNRPSEIRGKPVPGGKVYKLVMTGHNRRKFKELFYGFPRAEIGLSRLLNDGEKSILPMVGKRIEGYAGPVYNLEVEEDHSYSLLNATVHNCFATDSNGFFKRSLIESCVVGRPTRGDEDIPAWWDRFKPALKGPPGRTYVMALDPASERDNLSVVVLECWPNHRRVVFCWTVNRARHKAKLKRGLVSEENYYVYAARKVRDLMVDFPTVRLAIDSQGGGIPILEALADKANLRPGERPMYPVVDPDKPRPTDDLLGDHIIDVVEFSQGSWVSEANHGLRKDMEARELLFPEFDTALLALSHEEDKEAGRVRVDSADMTVEKLYDTLEDCVLEIEELKTELTTIVHTQTGTSMRDRWDTPELKQAGGKKGRLRKDRYSALLMANMSARTLARTPAAPEYRPVGGFARNIAAGGKRDRKDGPMFVGPAWWAGAGAGYGAVGRR